MNVLSLFNGMSCGEIALREIGIVPDVYYSSEIDKYAIAQTQLNFPSTIQLGSVVDVDVSKLEPIDLLLGGSPCQSFSFAGKRKGMATKCEIKITKLEQYLELKSQGFEFEGQSYLFWEYMRILTDIRKYNPNVKFLLENVEMGKSWEYVLSNAIGILGVHINSNLVSAQNRERIYWSNIRVGKIGMFDEMYTDIPLPADEGILLRDILEQDVDEKYFLSDKMLNYFDKRADNFNNGKVNIRDEDGKSTTLTASMASCDISDNFVKINTSLKQAKEQDKSGCLTAGGHSGGLHSDMDLICVAQRGRGENNTQQLEPNKTGKTNCLTSVAKDNLVMLSPRQQSNLRSTEEKANTFISTSWKGSQENGMTLVSLNENQQAKFNPNIDSSKANALTLAMGRAGSSSEYMVAVSKLANITGRIRRLTPTECARLQTVPDWYDWSGMSDTRRYQVLGNGWTIKVISHILNFLKQQK